MNLLFCSCVPALFLLLNCAWSRQTWDSRKARWKWKCSEHLEEAILELNISVWKYALEPGKWVLSSIASHLGYNWILQLLRKIKFSSNLICIFKVAVVGQRSYQSFTAQQTELFSSVSSKGAGILFKPSKWFWGHQKRPFTERSIANPINNAWMAPRDR